MQKYILTICAMFILFSMYIFFSLRRYRNLKKIYSIKDEMLDNAPGGLAIYEYDGEIKPIFLSDQVCKLFGFTREEYDKRMSKKIPANYDPEPEKIEDGIYMGYNIGELFNDLKLTSIPPILAKKQDGSTFWLNIKSNKIIKEGEKTKIYAILSDVTKEQERISEEINMNKKKLEAVIANAPVGVLRGVVKDGKFTFDFVSEQAAILHGDASEVVLMKLNEDPCSYIYPDDKQEVLEKINCFIEGDNTFVAQYRIVKRDGSYVWVSMIANPYTNVNGEIMYYCSCTDISEMRESLELLRMEKEKTDFILDLTNTAVWDYNLENDSCTLKNNLYQNIYAKTDDKYENNFIGISQKNCKIVGVCDDSVQDYQEMFERMKRGEKLIVKVIHMIDKDGKEEWKKIIYHTIFDSDNNPIGATGYSCDVTESVKNRQAFEKELVYLDEVHSEDLIDKGRINISTNILESYTSYYGDSLCEAGITYGEVLEIIARHTVGDNQIECIMYDFSADNVKEMYKEGITQHSFNYLRIIARDENPVWCRLTIKIFKNPETQALNAFLYTYNIDNEIMLTNVMYKLFDEDYNTVGLLDAVGGQLKIIKKSDSDILPNNSSVYTYNNLMDRFISKYIIEQEKDDATREFSLDNLVRKLSRTKKYSLSFNIRIEGELRRMKWDFLSMNSNNSSMVYTRTDITDVYRKGVEQQQRVTEALENAEKANAAKTEFLNTMSHDIRTPMNAILNITQMLREEIEANETESVLNDLDRLDNAGNFLKDLINDVLDVSRMESGKMILHPSVYELNQFIQYIVSVFEPLCIEKNIKFICNCEFSKIALYVDRTRLNQLFSNIFSNAVKYTPEDGRIHFRIYNAFIRDGMYICSFEIKDSGCGMSEEFQKTMFQPFERETRVVSEIEGTGLGLTIARNIVDIMNGNISVKSVQGKGTTIYIDLEIPLATKEQIKEHNSVNQKVHDTLTLNGKKVLVVEDNSINIAILERMLRKQKMETVTATNGKEAVEIFSKSEEDSISVILMDIRMPIMDGFEASKLIRNLPREDAKKVIIIAVTADVYAEFDNDDDYDNINDKLFKPIEAKKLYSMLKRYICNEHTDDIVDYYDDGIETGTSSEYNSFDSGSDMENCNNEVDNESENIEENGLIKALNEFGCVDIDKTISRCMNDIDFYQKLLIKMLLSEEFDLLEEQLHGTDVKAAFNTSHALKGIIANTGITPMSKNIEVIVEMLRNGKMIGTLPFYLELIRLQQDLLTTVLCLQ